MASDLSNRYEKLNLDLAQWELILNENNSIIETVKKSMKELDANGEVK